jgi:hypothetical protein
MDNRITDEVQKEISQVENGLEVQTLSQEVATLKN